MADILLTRSPQNNSRFEALLRDQSWHGVIHKRPLLSAVGLQLSEGVKETILKLDQYDKLIFISQNAVEFGMPMLETYWPQWPVSLGWFSVGPATASKLEAFDIPVTFPENASSEGLLAISSFQSPVDEKVLIVRGLGGRELLKETLLSRGAVVDYLEVYERRHVDYEGDFLGVSSDEVIATLYSGEAILRLGELAKLSAMTFRLLVPTERLRVMAFDAGFDKVELAANQKDESMCESVLRMLDA